LVKRETRGYGMNFGKEKKMKEKDRERDKGGK